MAQRLIKMEYEFTSTRADGDGYKITIDIRADNERAALAVARIEGFRHFGARFNDNCVDWRVLS
jgi:hypothetical protein